MSISIINTVIVMNLLMSMVTIQKKITFICWKGVTYVDVNFGVQYVDHCKYLDEDGDQEIVFSRWKCITDVESGDQYDDDCQYLDIKEKM